MSQIIKSGNVLSLANVDQVKATLPLGTYNLQYIPMAEFKLIQTEDFKLPPKIYGDLSLVERAITVYKHRSRNFGLLLSGLRGAGKSLLMKKIALDLHQPVIIVNQSFEDHSDEFIEFLTDKALGDCTILFDEFEKRFSREDVTPLTLMDGPYNTHHFFILTVNTTYINENLLNRPGRIYYRKVYCGLNDEMVREVGEDLLLDKKYLDDLVATCQDIRDLSFDMLISLINDVNLFDETPKECVKYFEFDNQSGQYITIYQELPNGEQVKVVDDDYMEPQHNSVLWAEDCVYYLNDGTKCTIDIKLDLAKMTKISRSKYYMTHELTANQIDKDEVGNFTQQTLKFHIEANSNKQLKFVL